MLEGREPLPVFYPLPQHFLRLVINSSFCQLAYILTEDTVRVGGQSTRQVRYSPESKPCSCAVVWGCLNCRQGRVLATDAVSGAFSLLRKASLPKGHSWATSPMIHYEITALNNSGHQLPSPTCFVLG